MGSRLVCAFGHPALFWSLARLRFFSSDSASIKLAIAHPLRLSNAAMFLECAAALAGSSFCPMRSLPLSRTHFGHSLSPKLPSRCPALISRSAPACVSPFCSLSAHDLATPPSNVEVNRSKPLEIVANPAGISKALLDGLPLLKQPYESYPLIRNRHQETIFAAWFRSLPEVIFRRECLRMQDNGTVALDWPVGGADCAVGPDHSAREGSPVLILLPGLTGGSGDTYVRHLLIRARKRGWNVVVFNSRGCADSPVITPQFYSASFTEDLREVVKHVGGLFPSSHLYAAGWSLGGNILVRYLGQEGENCPLSGAISLCNPFNLVIADEDFHKGFNNVYDSALARSLRKIFKKHAPLFEGIGGEYNIQKVAAARTVRDFDDGLTRVSFGYKSVDDYYRDASSFRSIKDVRVPLLCIQADDDPIAPSRGIPRDDIRENGNCFLVVTPSGGHLGWVAGKDAPFGAPWTDPLVMAYLELLESSGQAVFSK